MVRDTVTYLHNVLSSSTGKTVIVEGAQATMLDIDFGECRALVKMTYIRLRCMLIFVVRYNYR